MKRMIWTSACRTGFEEIDSQHRLLFAISNELLEISDPAHQELEIKYLLRHLREYVEKHFSFEENFMVEKKYPDAGEHKVKHEKIIAEINNTLLSSATMNEVKRKLELLLVSWVQDHILTDDKKFSEWAKFHNLARV